jgi:hypothetical protein
VLFVSKVKFLSPNLGVLDEGKGKRRFRLLEGYEIAS